MSDPNDKSASILLKKQGKTEAVFLYGFAQFTGQNEDAGLYRAKINGCWHCPDGKYTALSAAEQLACAPTTPARRTGGSCAGCPTNGSRE